MWIVLVIVAFWFVAILFVLGLCAAARRGEEVIARVGSARPAAPESSSEPVRVAA